MTTSSATRLDLDQITPQHLSALHRLAAESGADAQESGLDPILLELVRLRASQLNGCEFCTMLHSRLALENGETEQRLAELPTWAESARFAGHERAALLLTESVTRLSGGQVPDEHYRPAEEHFDRSQLAHLLWTITLINTFNRLSIGTRPSVN
ncbi:carboxymuconolactone decarboxylase family protein [Saccharopolyspora gloriosae]|uniref:AhpD family alkylhydroperoxidase n=1 Tax=Saccharopolyspora gloriosae TaxID=455344 RepID=A0A840NI28_9PSEU|nr:carboxymuconolactone decarboxylase family protein [Saccharopolyspora gloriosae]MBB5069843.1 AhpD family alkylhydroperoxidase [Saccharopolyspora gloriosae]